MSLTKDSAFRYFHQRQVGFKHQSAYNIHRNALRDSLWGQLYCDRKKSLKGKDLMNGCKGIFGLQYSPNGEVVVAACQNNSLVITDPISEKVIAVKKDAHTDCCNTVTFLDNRMFATSSDDCSIAIWDLRNMQQDVYRLFGHTSWVKNVEYHKPSDKLVSSGFDSKILAWSINEANGEGVILPENILDVQGLCRMRLSADGESMYISSIYMPDIIAIHNINITSISKDVGAITRGSGEGHELEYNAGQTKFTNKQRIWHHIKQNHVEMYKTTRNDRSEPPPSTYSIDVHPRNSAILLHQLGGDTVRTVVQNTKSYYDYLYVYECEYGQRPEDFFLRGCDTHVLELDCVCDIEFIKEASFSSCGKFIAIPFGYGVFLAAFDDKCSDYEACMASKLRSLMSETEKYDENGFVPKESPLEIQCASFGHSRPLLCTAFSPNRIQLATGCQGGKIALHNPYL